MSDRRKRILEGVDVVGRLLPDAIEWIRAMIAAGKSEDETRRDMADRTELIRSNRAEVDAAIDDKFTVQSGDDDGRA